MTDFPLPRGGIDAQRFQVVLGDHMQSESLAESEKNLQMSQVIFGQDMTG